MLSDEQDLGINANVPNPARIYDYFLGGKDNYPADREIGDQVLAIAPATRAIVQDNRAFLRRVVRYLAGEAGIRQFLDIGSGLPTQDNVHEVAHAVAPEAHVVYVDNDPVVVTHGRALLAGDNVTVVRADLREPERILQDAEVRELIDFDRPVALLLLAILHFVPDDQDPYAIVARFRDALPSGSYLAISHGTKDIPNRHDMTPEEMAEHARETERLYRQTSAPVTNRTRAQVERFFDGWELVAPGLVEIQRWRPDEAEPALPGGFYGGAGRKR